MSVKDLIANWEEALAVALSQPDDQDRVTEMHDDALTNVADRRIYARFRSNLHAGWADLPLWSAGACHSGLRSGIHVNL